MPLVMLPGRFGGARKSSQENCLFSDHHLTCEGWGRGSKDRTGAFRSFRGRLFCLLHIQHKGGKKMKGKNVLGILLLGLLLLVAAGCGEKSVPGNSGKELRPVLSPSFATI